MKYTFWAKINWCIDWNFISPSYEHHFYICDLCYILIVLFPFGVQITIPQNIFYDRRIKRRIAVHIHIWFTCYLSDSNRSREREPHMHREYSFCGATFKVPRSIEKSMHDGWNKYQSIKMHWSWQWGYIIYISE